MMKKLFISAVACLALVSMANAGTEAFKNDVKVKQTTSSFYRDKELNFGVYSLYGTKNKNWGGGAKANYFFTRNFALGLEGYARNGNGAVLVNATARLPIGESRFAPYAFVGGGTTLNSFDNFNGAQAIGQAGAGLEMRVNPHFGVFADISENAVAKFSNHATNVKMGLNLAF